MTTYVPPSYVEGCHQQLRSELSKNKIKTRPKAEWIRFYIKFAKLSNKVSIFVEEYLHRESMWENYQDQRFRDMSTHIKMPLMEKIRFLSMCRRVKHFLPLIFFCCFFFKNFLKKIRYKLI